MTYLKNSSLNLLNNCHCADAFQYHKEKCYLFTDPLFHILYFVFSYFSYIATEPFPVSFWHRVHDIYILVCDGWKYLDNLIILFWKKKSSKFWSYFSSVLFIFWSCYYCSNPKAIIERDLLLHLNFCKWLFVIELICDNLYWIIYFLYESFFFPYLEVSNTFSFLLITYVFKLLVMLFGFYFLENHLSQF